MKHHMLDQLFAMAGSGENFDPGVAIRQMTAIHGLLICVGKISYDEAISGEDALIIAEAYIKEKFKEHGIGDDDED
jgi:hypothetical protein